MQINIKCRFNMDITLLTELIKQHRKEGDKSLESFLWACKDTAHDLKCHCYFQLDNYTPDGNFQVEAVFL